MTQQELLQNFTVNLEKERIRLNLTQGQMAEKLDMSLSNYKKLVAGQYQRPNLFLAKHLYELSGKMLFEFFDFYTPQLNTIKKLTRLSDSQRNFIESIIDFELEFSSKSCDEPEDYLNVLVPTGNFEDGMIWDSADIKKVNIAPYRKKYGSQIHIGVEITSNHLSPVYCLGDIILISRRPPRDGDTGVFINKETGRAYIRRFLQQNPRVLEPVNGYGESFYVDPHDEDETLKWIKYGVILTKMRT